MEEKENKKDKWFYSVDQRFPNRGIKSIIFIPKSWKGWIALLLYYGTIFAVITILNNLIVNKLIFKIVSLIIIVPAIFFSYLFAESKSTE